jgi:hypothetical protein
VHDSGPDRRVALDEGGVVREHAEKLHRYRPTVNDFLSSVLELFPA